DDVADQRERPVASSPIAEVTRHQSEHITDQLTEARDDPDDRGTRPQHGEVGAGDTARAFIGHIGEQAHETQQDHEGHRGAPRQANAGTVKMGGCIHTRLLLRGKRTYGRRRQVCGARARRSCTRLRAAPWSCHWSMRPVCRSSSVSSSKKPADPLPLLPALYRVLLVLSTKGRRCEDVSGLALGAYRPFTHRLEDTHVLCLVARDAAGGKRAVADRP